MTKKIAQEVFTAFQKGDKKAYNTIIVSNYNKVKNIINGYIKSPQDAEELANDVFLKLWDARKAIKQSPDGYLYQIARNTALRFLETKIIEEDSLEEYMPFESTYNSEDEMIAKEMALLVQMIVEKMPEQRQTIYNLSRNTGLDNKTIADMLGTTSNNVSSQLSQALKEIKSGLVLYILCLLIMYT